MGSAWSLSNLDEVNSAIKIVVSDIQFKRGLDAPEGSYSSEFLESEQLKLIRSSIAEEVLPPRTLSADKLEQPLFGKLCLVFPFVEACALCFLSCVFYLQGRPTADIGEAIVAALGFAAIGIFFLVLHTKERRGIRALIESDPTLVG
jgi:hypothetical protein